MPEDSPATARQEAAGAEKTSLGKRFWAWFAAAATAIIVAVVSSLSTSAGEKFFGLGASAKSESKQKATPAGDPIKIVKTTVQPRENDNTWVFPQRLGTQDLNGMQDEFGSYDKSSAEIMRSHGGVETGVSTVELELEGNRADPVRIIDIGVRPRCGEPLHGALFYNPPQGQAETVQIGYDLDHDPAIAKHAKTDENDLLPRLTGNYFAGTKYSLKQGEQATFRLSAITREKYCEYTFELRYLSGGKYITKPVDNGGRPFRVSALISKSGAPDCSAYQQYFVPSERGCAKRSQSECG